MIAWMVDSNHFRFESSLLPSLCFLWFLFVVVGEGVLASAQSFLSERPLRSEPRFELRYFLVAAVSALNIAADLQCCLGFRDLRKYLR